MPLGPSVPRRTVWLASYPKSGNTWLRFFLANLLFPEQQPVGLNSLPLFTPIAASRIQFDRTLGVASSLLSEAEIARLRPRADRVLRDQWARPLLLRKAHDAYTWLPDGQPLLGRGAAFAAIYILRDPWDVALSNAHHFGCTPRESLAQLRDVGFVLSPSRRKLAKQLPQRLLSWEGHARSWLAAPLPVHVMRYEAMRRDPLPAFRGAVRFLGLAHDDAAIAAALEACRFERLRAQEAEQRFQEASPAAPRFFRGGRVGDGMDCFSSAELADLRAMRARVEAALRERGS